MPEMKTITLDDFPSSDRREIERWIIKLRQTTGPLRFVIKEHEIINSETPRSLMVIWLCDEVVIINDLEDFPHERYIKNRYGACTST